MWIGFKQEIMELIPALVAVYAVIRVAAYFDNRLFMYLPDPTIWLGRATAQTTAYFLIGECPEWVDTVDKVD